MTPILQLMHDTVSKLGTIKLSAELLKKGGLSLADHVKLLDGVIEKVNELNSVLDNHYKETKMKDMKIGKPALGLIEHPKLGMKVIWVNNIWEISGIDKKDREHIFLKRNTNEEAGVWLHQIDVIHIEYAIGENKKYIPLQESDWQYIINRRMIDKELDLSFNIVKCQWGKRNRKCAAIVNQEPGWDGIFNRLRNFIKQDHNHKFNLEIEAVERFFKNNYRAPKKLLT